MRVFASRDMYGRLRGVECAISQERTLRYQNMRVIDTAFVEMYEIFLRSANLPIRGLEGHQVTGDVSVRR